MGFIGSQPSPPANMNTEIHEISTISNKTIVLEKVPHAHSEFVIMNGLVMSMGANYDYLLTGDTIVFNDEVLTNDGHVLIKYSYI